MPLLSSSGMIRSALIIIAPTITSAFHTIRPFILNNQHNIPFTRQRHFTTTTTTTTLSLSSSSSTNANTNNPQFSLPLALFLAGFAFDAYAPPSSSSRWEKNPLGLHVAFQSLSYARTLYSSLLEITPLEATDLPENDESAAESLLSGGGIDAYVTAAALESKYSSDVTVLENERHHRGVLDLKEGGSHAIRSSVAWANVSEKAAANNKKEGKSGAYYVKGSWGRGGKAVWKDDPPLYLYVQDPTTVRLVMTLMNAEVASDDLVVGSVVKKLKDLIPEVMMKSEDLVAAGKEKALRLLKERGGGDGTLSDEELGTLTVPSWEGELKMVVKPKKKDKGGQMAMGAAAGAMIAGPAGAAVGGYFASMYEGEVRGKVKCRIRYLPIRSDDVKREKYKVKGGLPGVNWGDLYYSYIKKLPTFDTTTTTTTTSALTSSSSNIFAGDDLEICAFVTHEKTGCSCGIYRSLEKKLIVLSFRGTCTPIDLVTDASIVQTPWVEGVEEGEGVPMVHVGFRNSLNSISRRLKELTLAAISPSDSFSSYDLLITGHSLGGALATLFTTDVAQYGLDAGRSLPQLAPSEPWWKTLSQVFSSSDGGVGGKITGPPRPKSLRLYSFGSPRVGNEEFSSLFDSLLTKNDTNDAAAAGGGGGGITEAYRIVNDADVVARLPRSFNALIANVRYDHCGPTVLIQYPDETKKILKSKEKTHDNNKRTTDDDDNGSSKTTTTTTKTTIIPTIWIEGESDDKDCPVRDGTPLSSPLATGTLLGDLIERTKKDSTTEGMKTLEGIVGRLQSLTASDITSLVGIDKRYAEREAKMVQSILSGEALMHHLEPEYYGAMGRACGFVAMVGEELRSVDDDDEEEKGGGGDDGCVGEESVQVEV